jgi:hypothetical protein
VSAPRLLAAIFVALAAGCASVPATEEGKKYKPLSSYAADPFVPVNLYLNSNEQVAGTPLGMLVEYSAEQLRASGAFVRLDRGVQRWPVTLQARYELKKDTAPGDTARRVLGVMTFGLVPVHVTQVHTLYAEVLTEPDSVGALELTLTVRDRVSLYDFGDPERGERAAADALLEQLLAEVAQRKLIPRWAAFKPEPPKKKPPAPEGRPT